MEDMQNTNMESEEILKKEKSRKISLQEHLSHTGWMLLVSFFGGVIGSIVLMFLFSGGKFSESFSFFPSSVVQEEKNIPVASQKLIEEESATIAVVQKAAPAVVSIIVKKDVPIYRSNPFDFFFDPFDSSQTAPQMEKQEVGGGTGFFVSADGMIVTNRHVVNDVRAEYTAITQDGKEYSATVLARDPVRDVALVKISGENFPVLELGDSKNLQVGQTVIAIGNSLGEFSNSVSRGIVSGLQRDITAGSGLGGQTERLEGIIQTDAAINPGNSGGPLLDISGKVIGINTAIAEGAQNVGFALPIDSVKNSITQVRETGEISMPFIGVRYIILDKVIQEQNGLNYDYGALILRGESRTDLAVIPGSPADKAGIVENDIILEVDGEKVTQQNDLMEILSQYKVGDEITLTVWHKGSEKKVDLRLEKRQQ